ncbi:MAG: rod shape-determining protein MreC [Gemmatimonadetes bacterium]|nr:rod shape-determining protein MreC [Gemmatimonadota bacterium]
MNRGPGRSLSRSDTVLLVGCLVLSVVAMLLPTPWALVFASGVRATALAPVVWLQNNGEQWRTSRLELQVISSARDSASLAAQTLTSLRAENAGLRGLLALKSKISYRTVPAEVLHQATATEGRTLLLGTGSSDGVHIGNPVVSPDGLLGLIVSAESNSSVAMTWAHPDFAVSVTTADGSVMGIVAPTPGFAASESFLELRGVPYRDTVPTGTQVLTSGLTGVYPNGIPVGRVVGTRREEMGWERVYRLTPSANPGHVRHVLIYLIRETRLDR